MQKRVRFERHGSLGGVVWFIGWLFTIGYLKLSFWKGLLALIVWPYFLGAHFAETPPPAEAQLERPGPGPQTSAPVG